MAEKGSLLSAGDVKQKIESLSTPSTPLKTKKLDVELLLNSCIKNGDFAQIVKESDGISVLTTLFKNENDFELKAKITTLMLFLSLIGHSDPISGKLMSDINLLSLVNLLLEKDFNVLRQSFIGLKVLGEDVSKQGSGSASGPPIPKSSISFSLSAATVFIENVTALINPSSKLLSDIQKIEILSSFTQFVLTGVMGQASADAAKDTSAALSKSFSSAYAGFVMALESNHKGDFSPLDMVVAQILQLTKDGRLIAAVSVQLVQQDDYLSTVNGWLGGSKKFNLLYKASKDGFGTLAFHSKSDNKGATVTIITCTKGYVFGGYTPLSWASNSSWPRDESLQSFLFSLKNPRNEKPAKFGLVDKTYTIYCGPSYGPSFGGGADIRCSDNKNDVTTGYTHLSGTYYANPTGLDPNTVFTGARDFTAKDIEVYQVV